jgi:fructose-1,6-bisphosphatase I
MTDHMPLSRYTADYAGQDPLRLAVAAAVDAFAKASIEISDLIGCGALAGITGEAQPIRSEISMSALTRSCARR